MTIEDQAREVDLLRRIGAVYNKGDGLSPLGKAVFLNDTLHHSKGSLGTFKGLREIADDSIAVFNDHGRSDSALSLAALSGSQEVVFDMLGDSVVASEYAEHLGLREKARGISQSVFDKAKGDGDLAAAGRAALTIVKMKPSSDAYIGEVIEMLRGDRSGSDLNGAILHLLKHRIHGSTPRENMYSSGFRTESVSYSGGGSFRSSPFGDVSLGKLKTLLEDSDTASDKNAVESLVRQSYLLMQALEGIAEVDSDKHRHYGFEMKDAVLTSAARVAQLLGSENDRRRIVMKMTNSDRLIDLGRLYEREGDIETAKRCYGEAVKAEWSPLSKANIAKKLLKDPVLAFDLYKNAEDAASASCVLSQMGGFNVPPLNVNRALERGLSRKRHAIFHALSIAQDDKEFDSDLLVDLEKRYGVIRSINLDRLDFADTQQVDRHIASLTSVDLHDYAAVIAHAKGHTASEAGETKEAFQYLDRAKRLYFKSGWLSQAAVAANDMGDANTARELNVGAVRDLASHSHYDSAFKLIREHSLDEVRKEITLEAVVWAEKKGHHYFAGHYSNKMGLLGRAMKNYWKNSPTGEGDKNREYALLVFAHEFGGEGDLTFDRYLIESVPDLDVVKRRIVNEYGEPGTRNDETKARMERDKTDSQTVMGQVSLAIDYYLELDDNPQYMNLSNKHWPLTSIDRIAAGLAFAIEDEERALEIWEKRLPEHLVAVELHRYGRVEEGLGRLRKLESEADCGDDYCNLTTAYSLVGIDEETERFARLALEACPDRREHDRFWLAYQSNDNKEIIAAEVYYEAPGESSSIFERTAKLAHDSGLQDHMREVCREAMPYFEKNGAFSQARRCAEYIGDQARSELYAEIEDIFTEVRKQSSVDSSPTDV